MKSVQVQCTIIQSSVMILETLITVVCSVIWPLNGSEAGGDFVLTQTSLLLLGKLSYSYAN